MKTKVPQLLLATLLLALPGRDAVAQTTVPWWWFDFAFPPGTNLPGQTEPNGMTWAAAGPTGPQISIASNSLAVAGFGIPKARSQFQLATMQPLRYSYPPSQNRTMLPACPTDAELAALLSGELMNSR